MLRYSKITTKTRQYHDVYMMAQSVTDSQLHSGIFGNDNVAIELSV